MTPRRVGPRFWWTFLVVSLLVAGGLSVYASSHPDGLEAVAEWLGFHVDPEPAGPLPDYSVSGVHEAFSGPLAGVIGILAVLAVMSALTFALRPRRKP